MIRCAIRTSWRIARIPLSYVASAIVIVILAACAPRPPSTDAGADPDINDCCWCLVKPTCGVQACFDRVAKDTDGGSHCRWLHCGIPPFRETYHTGPCAKPALLVCYQGEDLDENRNGVCP